MLLYLMQPSDNLWQMTFSDINGLVQQNVDLRNKVHVLSTDLDKKDMELRVW
jgi:nucleoprotein TPR